MISGASQSFIVGPVLLNPFLNDFFYFIENESVHIVESKCGNLIQIFK